MNKAEFDAAFANEEFCGGNLSTSRIRRDAIKLTADFCSVDEGWLQIIHDLVKDLIKLGWDRDIHQIKEKFGGLRFYIGAEDDAIGKRVSQAESESLRTCERCGTTQDVETKGQWWILTLCNPCRVIHDAERTAGTAPKA